MKWKPDGKGNYIYGDYAITEVQNAFNHKRSYWISKCGCAKAYYCFTYWNEKNLEENLNSLNWIGHFEAMNKR